MRTHSNGKPKPPTSGDWIAVLDIGSSKVVCLAATDDGEGGFDLVGLAVAECKGVKRGVVSDLEETSRAIDAAVRRVEQQLDAKIESLVVTQFGAIDGTSQHADGFIVDIQRHWKRMSIFAAVRQREAGRITEACWRAMQYLCDQRKRCNCARTNAGCQ